MKIISALRAARCEYQDNVFMRNMLFYYSEYSLYCKVPIENAIKINDFINSF